MSATVSKIKANGRKSGLNSILKDKTKRTRLFFLLTGIILIFWGLSMQDQSVRENKNVSSDPQIIAADSVTSFSQEPVKVDPSLLKYKKDNRKVPPSRIIIPSLEIDLPVREAKIVKGYWEVFADTAGFGLGSAYPGEIGNQVVFAHARKGLFLPLRNAKIGQKIYVFAEDKVFNYQIKEIIEVTPNQIEVLAPSSEAILTLYTCSGFSDSKRLIVKAVQL